jgi:hypothetical protein
MDCRTFQKQLEDYLENGLDFAGRFAMERHAGHCVHCGRKMTDAQELSRMARELDRVKAPLDFESSVLNEIAARKLHRRFSLLERLPVFGLDMRSWQKLALAVSVCTILGLGFLFWYGPGAMHSSRIGNQALNVPADPAYVETDERNAPTSPDDAMVASGNLAHRPEIRIERTRQGLSFQFQTDDADYREYPAIGTDNLPMFVPLPNTIRMQVNLPSEEYYIKNVSH